MDVPKVATCESVARRPLQKDEISDKFSYRRSVANLPGAEKNNKDSVRELIS